MDCDILLIRRLVERDDCKVVRAYDCIVIATNHRAFDLEGLLEHADLVIDTRNAIAGAGLTPGKGQVVKA